VFTRRFYYYFKNIVYINLNIARKKGSFCGRQKAGTTRQRNRMKATRGVDRGQSGKANGR
jgi:hypothetical protein